MGFNVKRLRNPTGSSNQRLSAPFEKNANILMYSREI